MGDIGYNKSLFRALDSRMRKVRRRTDLADFISGAITGYRKEQEYQAADALGQELGMTKGAARYISPNILAQAKLNKQIAEESAKRNDMMERARMSDSNAASLARMEMEKENRLAELGASDKSAIARLEMAHKNELARLGLEKEWDTRKLEAADELESARQLNYLDAQRRNQLDLERTRSSNDLRNIMYQEGSHNLREGMSQIGQFARAMATRREGARSMTIPGVPEMSTEQRNWHNSKQTRLKEVESAILERQQDLMELEDLDDDQIARINAEIKQFSDERGRLVREIGAVEDAVRGGYGASIPMSPDELRASLDLEAASTFKKIRSFYGKPPR